MTLKQSIIEFKDRLSAKWFERKGKFYYVDSKGKECEFSVQRIVGHAVVNNRERLEKLDKALTKLFDNVVICGYSVSFEDNGQKYRMDIHGAVLAASLKSDWANVDKAKAAEAKLIRTVRSTFK